MAQKPQNMTQPIPLTLAIVAGEASGDLLGADIITHLRQHYPQLNIIGIGGPKMIAAGMHSLFPMERLAVMGLVEVLGRLWELLRIRRQLIKQLLQAKPALFIGIDAPDFNLPIERKLKQAGIITVHYNSPTIWAWRPKRIYQIAKSTDLMLTLFPFEAPLYHQHQLQACYVGHPLADTIPLHPNTQQARQDLGIALEQPVITLMPGSRANEIEYLGACFIKTATWCLQQRAELLFIAPMINSQRAEQFQKLLDQHAPNLAIRVLIGQSHLAMAAADAILVASGTASLEALLFKKPMVVAYKLAPFSYWLAKRLVKLSQVALPNILAGKNLVPEFLQDDATPEHLGKALLAQLALPSEARQQLLNDYLAIHQQLKCQASQSACDAILSLIQ